ncbi:hypothetical protein B6V01_005175 [Methanosarcinales archaeon ex4572_44]|nr:MAG: hypothetical protein B6U67_04700 [Methanosarcinales archaeon ex4484_138]PHP45189.1 MAG: hypothetical protein B6V01_005175 [Methanosarcinales archaeon ex4572_44]RLG25265.1 MAG: hypothetical protein DRN85_06215 [Methanosarcinales archaeon]RLG26001.1 MAG: hypothetical protein DRN70_03625 [Methanosarcinales archaeon]HHI30644.1 DUF1894 domain-containing protein [Candidatus Methanoperedenaceae archaeon]
MAACVEEMDYEILLARRPLDECSKLIRKRCREIYFANPGFRVFELHLIGVPPIPIGIENEHLIIIYVKPCHGAFVLKLPGDGEVDRIRAELKKS